MDHVGGNALQPDDGGSSALSLRADVSLSGCRCDDVHTVHGAVFRYAIVEFSQQSENVEALFKEGGQRPDQKGLADAERSAGHDPADLH